MSTTTHAIAAATSGAPLAPATIERRDLRADDVLIDLAYAGICHSDIHQVNQDGGTAIFPMVPGHEIAGVVAAVGADVTKYQVGDRVGVILNTVSANLPVDSYLGLLLVGGAMVNVGAPANPQSYNAMSLIAGNNVLAGSAIGGIAETQEMLDFCAEHGVGAEIETISGDQVNAAYERVENSDVRYRFVIDASTIGA
ncbi:alcohol dehydrogenase catalytic domain-containing protein [Pseudonocardia sp.]|jgi:D-arabinose 1-dehydrogenase-like Zn-dependent alcohol dehydrogenase|uniref:alcohol dehydrogenase catalytic domain-containing protein n=1 Tax=Pseudonocardia sp. TaxID=60912 RepID=UPI0031FC4F79